MKVSKIVLVLAIALAVASIAVPAGAWFGPACGFGLGGFGLGGCGFGVPFGVAGGAAFQSSFVATSSFSTFGTAGLGCGLGGFGLGGLGCGLGGFGLGGCGFGSPFGFC
ncbi:MAG TPA: hypothetical protein VGJ92_00260 [Methanocella sp.]